MNNTHINHIYNEVRAAKREKKIIGTISPHAIFIWWKTGLRYHTVPGSLLGNRPVRPEGLWSWGQTKTCIFELRYLLETDLPTFVKLSTVSRVVVDVKLKAL